MKEPLLSAIVTDEPESAIPDQPFNRAVRHVDVPPGTVDGPSWINPIKLRSTIRQTLREETPPRRQWLELACARLKCEDSLRDN